MAIHNSLTCPHCNKKVDLSEALSHDLEEAVRQRLEEQFSTKEDILKAKLASLEKEKLEAIKNAEIEKANIQTKLKEDLSRELTNKFNLENNDLRNQLEEQKEKAKEAESKELELRKLKRELETQKTQQEDDLKKRIEDALKNKEQDFAKKLKDAEDSKNAALEAAELEKSKIKENLEKALSKSIEAKFTLEQQDLKNQLEEERKKAEEAIKKELELRKQQRELEEQQKNLKLEVERQLDDERKKIADETMKQAQAESAQIIEQQNLKMLELQKALDDARRKAAQGSQQTQGEALELRLEDELSRLFPQDSFEAVPKGIKGADLIQRVRSSTGKLAGTIIWEFKQTKNWSDDWLYKLKEDQRELSAELAAIVSSTLPKDINHLGSVENIWITQPGLAKSLAYMLREQILQVYQARLTNMIPADQKENVFKYLTGTKFKQSIEGEIETVSTLLGDLQKEKKALTKMWATREQQLNQLLSFKAGLYGDLQGILGKSLPAIPHLELGEPEET